VNVGPLSVPSEITAACPALPHAGREMIDLLAVEEPKPKPAKIRAVSYEAAIDQLFKRMRSSSPKLP
jgi:hypothetical protein